MAPPALFAVAAGCLFLAFWFALFENALQHFARVKLLAEAKRQGKDEALATLLDQEDEIFFASKVGRGLTQLFGVALLVVALVASGGDNATRTLGLALLLGFLFLVINVAAPYVLGERFAEGILLRMLRPYARVITPLVAASGLLQRLTVSILRTTEQEDPTEEITDEILSAVDEGAREGSLEDTEKRMIEGIIDLRDVSADHVMTPRTEMVSLRIDAEVADALARSQERGLSRLPVYRDTPDDIAGVLYMKDLLPYLGKDTTPPVKALLRTPLFVPQTKNVRELLQEMRVHQMHLAIVLDEYGGTAGLVTIEDILEEIVGEIADEHEGAGNVEVLRIADNVATVEGRTHIDDLNDALNTEIPESDEYETVGGLLFTRLGRVPAAGEKCDVDGIHFTVLESDERRIHRVKVTVEREFA
jgi:CBS domain containing-hemolysin-like protein